jgi:hypothetical protein
VFSISSFMNKSKPPVIASYSTYSRNSLATSDVIPMPSGVQPGDLLIALFDRVIIGSYYNAGWIELQQTPDSTRYKAFFRIADGTEGSSQTFTNGNNQRLSAASILRITGVNQVTPIDYFKWSSLTSAAQFTASVTAGVMTVTAVASGTIHIGDVLSGSTTPENVTITSLGTGNGGTGTYNLSNSGFSQASGAMYSIPATKAISSLSPNESNNLQFVTNFNGGGNLSSIALTTTFDSSITKLFDLASYSSAGSNFSVGYQNILNVSATGSQTAGQNVAPFNQATFNMLIEPYGKIPGVTFATWNPSDKGSGITLNAGNLTTSGTGTSGHQFSVRANQGKSAGKWYWEIYVTNSQLTAGMGNSSAPLGGTPNGYVGIDNNSIGIWETGAIYKNSSLLYNSGIALGYSSILGFAYDAGASTLAFYINGILKYTASGANIPSGTLYPMWGTDNTTISTSAVNFGQYPFVYSVPSGYNAGVYQ